MEKKRPALREPAPAPVVPAKSTPGASEIGWLPDYVFTGEKFEAGLAFFADGLGRITRFSREPADVAQARRLEGQAALPGLVNAHSHAFHRVLRGRGRRGREALAAWQEAHDRAAHQLTADDVFDAAQMAFMEMLLSGITCVGEFHYVHHQPDGAPWPDPNLASRAVLRAAHDVGIRIALLKVAWARGNFRGGSDSAPPRARIATAEQFIRDCDALRAFMAEKFPDDEAWLGVAAQGLGAVPLDYFKAIAAYAHARRMRLHAHVASGVEENQACAAEYSRTPVALLAEHGIIDKRFTAVDARHLGDDEVKILGSARATVCVCPSTEGYFGLGIAPVDKLFASGAPVALGTDSQLQSGLVHEARLMDYTARASRGAASSLGESPAALLHAATVAGARSLGATGGALEVGRPADFFTVNLYEPAFAGADHESLLATVLSALERRAIREVWVGARQRIANGRHPAHGLIVGRFVELQKKLWAAS